MQDILGALTKLEQYTAGLDSQAFAVDDMTVDAVLSNLVIIGEAARVIPDSVTARWSAIPWVRMQVLGEAVVDRYYAVDRAEIWSTVVQDLPPLALQLKVILESRDDAS